MSMRYYEVAPVKIVRSGSDYFTYCSESNIEKGKVVIVEVGKKKIIGLIINSATKPKYPTKPIESVLEIPPIPEQLLKTILWIAEYYLTPLAIVLQAALPKGIDKTRRPSEKITDITKRYRTNILFNKEQSACIETLNKYNNGTFLLQGITGSGKTEVYIELAKQSILNDKSVIVLVPEIALTSQLVSEFSNHFSDLLVTHSKMTESQRHQIWLEILNSDKPRIIIGPRSALFMPLKKIGAIIIDEAHEPSYKQEQSPKYSAIRVATILGRHHKAIVLLGSATPNAIDRYLADKSDKPILKLTKVARKDSILPDINLIDMTKYSNFSKHRFISDKMISEITETLNNKKQVLIFHNRRGSAKITQCKKCGWNAICQRCLVPMSLHNDNYELMCHLCGNRQPVPTSCPECHDINIIHKGIGTKLIESEIKKLFPNSNVARFDNDNKDNETLNERYKEVYSGDIDVIIGTQVIAKGLDLPNLRTVCIIQADSGLSLPDYNSNERSFQLIAQVVGRVGRNEHKTKVVIQTFQPKHPSIAYGLKQDYESFYKELLKERQRANFPPFTHLLKVSCAFKTEAAAIKNSKELAIFLRKKLHKDMTIIGPLPTFYERINNKYHWQVILKSPKRDNLIKALKSLPKTNWQFELEPTSLLK
jgi:primosomal protein N' (replication factor Y) (superfamily II helicase)